MGIDRHGPARAAGTDGQPQRAGRAAARGQRGGRAGGG